MRRRTLIELGLVVLATTIFGFVVLTVTGVEALTYNSGTVPDASLGVMGVEWDQDADTWRHLDLAGSTATYVTADFDANPVWGGMRPVNLATDGEINYVYGDASFAWDGTAGRVMVEIPKFYVKTEKAEGPKYRWWISPIDRAGFEIHPAFIQGDRVKNFIYLSAKQADFEYNSTDSKIVLNSRTGYQPFTGNQCIWGATFDAGQNEPDIGDTVSTPNEASMMVVDYDVTAGTWAGNNAEGRLWVRKPGDSACGWQDDDVITNNSQTNTLAVCEFTTGNLAVEELTQALAREYSQNIGSDWSLMSIWTFKAVHLLYYVEYADPDNQTTIAKGIVDLPSGTGWAGRLTGADGVDGNVGTNGTGSGTGTNGETPIMYRWVENLWGNSQVHVDGINAIVDDSEYQVLNRKGTNTALDTMSQGQTPLASSTALQTGDSWVTDIVWDEGYELLFLPKTTGAAGEGAYLHSMTWGADVGDINIMLAGSGFSGADGFGLSTVNLQNTAGRSKRGVCARFEYGNPEVVGAWTYPDSVYFGTPTNHLKISEGGIVTMTGTAERTLTLRADFNSAHQVSKTKPTEVFVGIFFGYSMPLYAEDEEMFFTEDVPGRWDGASDIGFHVMVALAAAETAGEDFRFELAWNYGQEGEILPGDSTSVQTQTELLADRAAQYDLYWVEFTLDWDVDSPTRVVEIHNVLSGRLRRIDVVDGDECEGEIIVMDWHTHYTVDKMFKAPE